MAVQASGTQTATLGTEHTLATVTAAGTYYLEVDTAALAAGETLLLSQKVKTLSGGTTRLESTGLYKHVQGVPIKRSVPIQSDQEYVATLKQTGGTGRAYPWKVMSL